MVELADASALNQATKCAVKPRKKTETRSWRFHWRGLVGALCVAISGAAALLSQPLVPEESWLDITLDALAWTMFIAGAGMRFWATLYIGGRKHDMVVNDGPYSIVRNPLYVGSFLLVFSMALYLKSPTFAAGLAAATVAYAVTTIPEEERHLGELFEEKYAIYCETVPRFWPRFSVFHTPATIEVETKALVTECRRAVRWLWIPLAGEVVSHLRFQPWWPHLFNLP
jgi:protein-S-isoprenylcysteine O-methyltransferase Ste14